MKNMEFNKRVFRGHGRNKYLENGTDCKESEDVLFKLIHLFWEMHHSTHVEVREQLALPLLPPM